MPPALARLRWLRAPWNRLRRLATFRLLAHAWVYGRASRTCPAPDVVHAHDLYTLLAGVWIARRHKARLLYDAHELETARAEGAIRLAGHTLLTQGGSGGGGVVAGLTRHAMGGVGGAVA